MMKKRKYLHLFSLATVRALLLLTSRAFTYSVPDTGDPNERICNPQSYTALGNGIIKTVYRI